MGKSLKISLKNDRVERIEGMMLAFEKALYRNIDVLQKDMANVRLLAEEIREGQELFYEAFMAHTLAGRWAQLVRRLSRKK